VSWNGKTGYIFDGFLLPQTAPESNLGIDDYFAKMYPKQGEAISWASENGEQYTQTIHDKGAFIITAKSKGYTSTQYYLTGLSLQKAFLLCKLFTPFAELIGETENFPMSDMDRNGRVVKQLYSPNPAIKNVIGIYILDKNSTFRIRENEGRIEITYSRTEA
jgi:hypothetical protein